MKNKKPSLPCGIKMFDINTFTPDFIEPGQKIDICIVLEPKGFRHTSITAKLTITYNIYENIVRSILKDKLISHEALVKATIPTKELFAGLCRHIEDMDLKFIENMPSE